MSESVVPAASRAQESGRFKTHAKLLLLTVVVIVTLLVVKSAAQVLLLLFMGILLAIFLRSLSDWVAKRTPLGERWALLGVVLALLLLFAGGTMIGTARLGPQVKQLRTSVPESMERLKKDLAHLTWGTPVQAVGQQPERYLISHQTLMDRLGGIFSTTLGALSAAVVIIFLGLCLAIEPRTYMRGVLRFVPRPRRPKTRALMEELNHTLSTWLFAKLLSMTIVGVLMWIGLVSLGIPLAFSLAVLAGLLDFVPNIGPIVAGIPAVLFAFSQSSSSALHVLLLYVGVQTLESYFITPFIERKTVSLPPALTGTAQLILALLVGIPGVIVAAPLTLAGMIIIQRLYVEGALGDNLEHDPLDDARQLDPDAPAPPRINLPQELPPPEQPEPPK